MKNTVKRLLAVFVALLMVASVGVSAFALEAKPFDEQPQSVNGPLESKATASYDLSGIRNGKTFDISNENVAEEIAADQIVPIMVELQDAPAMEVYSQYKAAQSYAASLREKQDVAVKSLRTALNTDIKVLYNYSLLFNGFSFNGEYRLVEEINKIEGMRAFVAAEWETPQPQLFSSTDMIGAPEAWDLDYTGMGKIIAIVDTGMLVTHPAFSTAPEEVRFTKADIGAIISSGQLLDSSSMNVNNVYYSAKIPFRWNYVKHNYNVNHASVGSDHGTHVGGIAAGNGGEIVGVAKDAQLAAMNVFNDGGGAGWQAILSALEDCVVLGVDAANMSLGSPCGFTHYYDPSYSEVFENLVNAGVNLAVSAGNEYSTALRNKWNPTGIGYALAINPDYGVTGSPSTWAESLGVASVDNGFQQMNYIENVANGAQYSYTENSENAAQLIPSFGGQTLDFVAVPGYGEIADFQQVDVRGKVAVVSRGEINFVTKGQNAQAAGAIACIVYNNADGSVNMVSDPSITIPFIFCLKDAGDEMAEMGEGQLFIATEPAILEAPGAGLPSDFSSWGTTSDLFMKPEIAAPGGNIYSSTDPSISNTQYDTWSGTSMAAPHVAGGMAIVTEYVEEMFPNASTAEKQALVNAILMSTADPVPDTEGSFAAVRKQGAGLMDLASAVTTTSYINVPGCVRPKIELGDDPEQTGVYELNFQVVNFGETAIDYEVVPYVLVDDLTAIAQDDEGNLVIAYNQTSWDVTDYCEVDGPEVVTVPAGETVDVNLTITLIPDLVDYYNQYCPAGFYVEGFVELYGMGGLTGDVNNDKVLDTVDVMEVMRYDLGIGELDNPAAADVNGDGVIDMTDALIILRHVLGIEQNVEFEETAAGTDLNVPFLGFCGDWNAAPMFDCGFYYDDFSYASNPNSDNFIGSMYEGQGVGLGINPYIDTEDMSYYMPERNAVSPNEDGFLDTADTIRIGLMRNAEEAGYELLNANGGVIATLAHQNEVRKSYYSTSSQTYSNLGTDMPLVKWNAAPYAGQQLYIRAYAYLANDGTVTTNAFDPEDNLFCEWMIPVFVDTQAPTAEIISYQNGSLELDIHDNHFAAYVGALEGGMQNGELVLGDVIAEYGIFEDGPDADVQVTFNNIEAGTLICLGDYAGNEVAYVFDGETLEPIADSWSHQNHAVAIPDIDIYSFASNLTAGGDGSPWIAFNTLDMGNYQGIPGNMSDDPSDYQCGGAVIGTRIYGVNSSNQLVYLDASASNWAGPTVVGTLTASTVYEMAYNPADGNLYIASGFNDIYRVNVDTAACTKVCSTPYGVVAMGFGDDGTLYVVDVYGALSVIDLATGAYQGDIVESYGINPVNLSTGNLIPQNGTVCGNWFVWVALDYTATEFSQIHLILTDVETGEYVDVGAPYIAQSSGNLYFFSKCIFGFLNEPIEIPDASVDPVDFYDNFEDLEFHWETVDADGDGKTWEVKYWDDGMYQDGSRAAVSYSWEDVVLYPDNYMISEPISIADGEKYLSYFTASANQSAGADIDEHWQVIVIPEGFTYENGIVVDEQIMTTALPTEHIVDMSDFAGETVQIAFRHFDCFDEYTLIIDSVGIGDLID